MVEPRRKILEEAKMSTAWFKKHGDSIPTPIAGRKSNQYGRDFPPVKYLMDNSGLEGLGRAKHDLNND